MNLADHLVSVALAVVVIAVERETVRITTTTKKPGVEEVTDEGALYRRREGGTITLSEDRGVRRMLGEGTAPIGNSRGTRIVTRRGREGLDRIATEIVAMIEVVTTTEIGEGKPCV